VRQRLTSREHSPVRQYVFSSCLPRRIQEATAADPSGDRRDAERRAIATCGDAYAIVAEFAAIALSRRAKRLAFWLVLALLGVLLAMKGHGAWYVAMEWGIPPHMRPAATLIGGIARYAFLTGQC
jgi:hypothetical protein